MGRDSRGHGEGSVYRDAANCTWVGAISLGWRPDGSRIRRKVTGRTKTEVRDKLKKLQAEADAGLKTSASYTLSKAVEDWAAEALDGLAAKTVRSHVDLLKPVATLIGQVPLRDLTAHDVRRALNKLAETRSTRTMASTHNVLVRAIRHAEANDHVGRNVASFVKPPQGKTGRPSRAMTAAEAAALLAAAKDHPRLGAYVVLSLTTGIRTEEARALRWDHVDLDGDPDARLPVPPSIAVWRSVRLHGDTKTEKSRRTLALPQNAVAALREHRKWQAEARLAAGTLWHDTGLVFTTSVGSAEPVPITDTERDAKPSETATRIGDLAAQHHAFRQRTAQRQHQMTPRKDLDGAALGDTLPSWWAPRLDAILRPPKPEITPPAKILQLAAEQDIELEAGG
jgi:integrase